MGVCSGPLECALSWCEQSWNNGGQPLFSLRDRAQGIQSVVASAEDRALRGRNLSAVWSLINGQSGCRTAARLALAGISSKAINPSSCYLGAMKNINSLTHWLAA